MIQDGGRRAHDNVTCENEDKVSDVLNRIERPVHEAVCLGKILAQ